jgi:biotin-(acetyl-CoA carboxylase) ligase
VGGEARSGVTTGIDDEGALLVRVGDHVERIVAGEIRWAAYPATSGIE